MRFLPFASIQVPDCNLLLLIKHYKAFVKAAVLAKNKKKNPKIKRSAGAELHITEIVIYI